MENFEIYLQEIMRNVASALMLPVMIVLVLLILFSVYSVGALIAEFVVERRHFKANMPRDIKAIKDSSFEDLPQVIESTGLLRKQKTALQVIVANMGLPEDDLFALAKSEVSATDARYRRKVSRTELVTKIAPMMGLMCTLIPLGPGIVAMGQGEVNILSNSLLVAFDGTVAGLIGGVVSMCVSAVRKRWYAQYLVAMEALTTCVLEKADEARKQGIKLPYEGDVRARAEAYRAGATKKTGLKPADQKTLSDASAEPGQTDQYLQGYAGTAPARSTSASQLGREVSDARQVPVSQPVRETATIQPAPVSWPVRETATVQPAPVSWPVRETAAVQPVPVYQSSREVAAAQQIPISQSSREVAAAQPVPVSQSSRGTVASQPMPASQSGWETAARQAVPASQPNRERATGQSTPLSQSGWGVRK